MDLLARDLQILAVLGLIACVVRFEVFCLNDVLHAAYVRTLPREVWVALCVLMIPIGGLLYFRYGRPFR
jgi:hypothetical protein